MKHTVNSIRHEMSIARQTWRDLEVARLKDLRYLLVRYKFSVILGEITRIDSRWYVTHSGLLQLASRRGCRGIRTILQNQFSDLTAGRWVFKAIVLRSLFQRLCRLRRRRSVQHIRPLFGAPKCVSPKREPLIGPSEKLTESGSAVSKSSDRSRHRKSPSSSRRIRMATPDRTAQATASPDCGTSSAS